MIVVPHRPLRKAGMFLFLLLSVMAAGYITYDFGVRVGLVLKAELLAEKERLQSQLIASEKAAAVMRQEIVRLKLGGEVDSLANEEVRQSVESLQDQVARLSEEVRFYKGVMVPNAEDKGLRIEHLVMENTYEPNKYKYNLLLTQVVDKHDIVQGGVKITLVGWEDGEETELLLSDLIKGGKTEIAFRFRYFQNMDGELVLPGGFEPMEVKVVAQSSGKNAQRLERKFDWQLNGE